jgi:cell wall-associated NlpC family hydrolase
MDEGIDCSNYTWQLYRFLGMGYDRFLSTMALSRLDRANGLHKISFEDALAGDLLVYGYRDEAERWRGHVVILVDKDGGTTGHRGLVLGAHGGSVDEVQYVTFSGFDNGYFKDSQMRLVNVLRVDGTQEKREVD